MSRPPWQCLCIRWACCFRLLYWTRTGRGNDSMEQQKDVINPQPRVFSHVRPGAFPFIRNLLFIHYLFSSVSIWIGEHWRLAARLCGAEHPIPPALRTLASTYRGPAIQRAIQRSRALSFKKRHPSWPRSAFRCSKDQLSNCQPSGVLKMDTTDRPLKVLIVGAGTQPSKAFLLTSSCLTL